MERTNELETMSDFRQNALMQREKLDLTIILPFDEEKLTKQTKFFVKRMKLEIITASNNDKPLNYKKTFIQISKEYENSNIGRTGQFYVNPFYFHIKDEEY